MQSICINSPGPHLILSKHCKVPHSVCDLSLDSPPLLLLQRDVVSHPLFFFCYFLYAWWIPFAPEFNSARHVDMQAGSCVCPAADR
jgi:hypothetical protein